MNILRLASSSVARREMLGAAGVPFEVVPARVDEQSIRDAMIAEGAKPRELADALAEAKARRVGEKYLSGMTLGADQVLEYRGAVVSKAENPEEAREILALLSGDSHMLWSAAVIFEDGRPVWRHVGQARMKMRILSEGFIDSYVARFWDDISASVGCYRIEAEGIRLFDTIGSDYHSILGLPLLPLLNYLTVRGILET